MNPTPLSSLMHTDADLIALGVEFRKAWADERAAFSDSGEDFDKDPSIAAASHRCSELSDRILTLTPETMDGARVAAMVWGWCHYLNSQPGVYDGGEFSNAADTRAVHKVLTFLLKDCAA
ncbi:hypothetical protein [Mesorhizobium sp. M0771]|uniref:hypothetical protein n=1 Tax=Mesorhizobium sp. M0771 TaxID=2956997 RepID=UPI003338BAE7